MRNVSCTTGGTGLQLDKRHLYSAIKKRRRRTAVEIYRPRLEDQCVHACVIIVRNYKEEKSRVSKADIYESQSISYFNIYDS